MSTLAITAAHFVAIPVRYAVGRWYNIPTNTLLAFNAADVGLNILEKSIEHYYKTNTWKLTFHQKVTLGIVGRSCVMLSAFYITSKLAHPMPIQCAVMMNLAAYITIFALVSLTQWGQKKMNKFTKGAS